MLFAFAFTSLFDCSDRIPQVDKLTSDAASAQDQHLGVLAGLQDRLSGLSDTLTQQVAVLRREFKPALQAHEVSACHVLTCLCCCLASTSPKPKFDVQPNAKREHDDREPWR